MIDLEAQAREFLKNEHGRLGDVYQIMAAFARRVRVEALREAAEHASNAQEWEYESGESVSKVCRSIARDIEALADEAEAG